MTEQHNGFTVIKIPIIFLIVLWSWVIVAIVFNHGQLDFSYHPQTLEQISNLRGFS